MKIVFWVSMTHISEALELPKLKTLEHLRSSWRIRQFLLFHKPKKIAELTNIKVSPNTQVYPLVSLNFLLDRFKLEKFQRLMTLRMIINRKIILKPSKLVPSILVNKKTLLSKSVI